MAVFVLVHGAGHGGWCYQRVAQILRNDGHEVYTPTLTGLGERSHLLSPDVNLETHINDVVNVIQFERLDDVILAGHSYGGPVVTGVADRVADRLRGLVYLDAAYIGNGQSVSATFGDIIEAVRAMGEAVGGVECFLLPEPDGGPFYGVEDPDDQAWMAGRLTAMPWACFSQPLSLRNEAAVAKIPTYHVLCDNSPANIAPAVRDAATVAGRFFHVHTGHDLMISEPQATADILMKVAADT